MNNKLTIFNTCVEVTQEQADRLKQVCIDNGLPIWKDTVAFKILGYNRLFQFSGREFWVLGEMNKKRITESEWMELLKQHNDEINS